MAGYTQAISLLKTGPSRPTLYQVEVPFSSEDQGARNYLRLFCKSISIPGVSHDALFLTGYNKLGVSRSVPVGASFNNGTPIELSVIENSNWDTYRAMRRIWDRTATGTNPQQGSANIRMSYYDDCVLPSLDITKLELPDLGVGDKRGQERFNREDGYLAGYKKTCKITFHKVMPTAIGDINLSSEAVDTALEFDIGFTFETYSYDFNIDNE